MFTAFTVQACQLLEGHVRPGDKPTKATSAISAARVADEILMRKPSRNGSELVGRSSARSRVLTMDWGGKMFTAFTVQVCQLLEGHIRPRDQRTSLAVRTTEQEAHERPALNP